MLSRPELLSYSHRGLAGRLPRNVWLQLVSLGICNLPPTHRGTRARAEVTVTSTVRKISPCFHWSGGIATSIKAAMLSIRSVRKKCDLIIDYMADSWYDADLIAAKQKKRRSELRWRRSRLTVHRQMYIEQRQAVARLLRAKKSQYYSNQVKENASDPKIIFWHS